MSSEDGAAGAASWSKVLFNLVLEQGAPRDYASEDVLLLAVVRHRDGVAFLATGGVDNADGSASGFVDLFGAHDLKRVDATRGQALASSRGRESEGL